MLSEQEYANYLQQILSIFKPAQHSPTYQSVIDKNHIIVFASDLASQSVGILNNQEILGFSFVNTEAILEYFNKERLQEQLKNAYTENSQQDILNYCNKLVYLQKLALKKKKTIKFIDMLPYDNQLTAYMTTYNPIFHPSGESVAIHSSSIKTYILRFQGHIQHPEKSGFDNMPNNNKSPRQFSQRELEILFLLSNGASQEQIAQILNIARGTVSAIITNQLCPKFSIAGANTKILIQKAIDGGYYRQMPASLWKPCLIVLNEELLDDTNFSQNAADGTPIGN